MAFETNWPTMYASKSPGDAKVEGTGLINGQIAQLVSQPTDSKPGQRGMPKQGWLEEYHFRN